MIYGPGPVIVPVAVVVPLGESCHWMVTVEFCSGVPSVEPVQVVFGTPGGGHMRNSLPAVVVKMIFAPIALTGVVALAE